MFITSIFGSLTRADFNATYELLSYVYLSQYKSKQSLASTLFVLILITVFVIGADIWAILVQKQAK